jgi:exonuclease VII small subunit
MSENKWKNFLLKSSLPLEYEVQRLLENNDYQTEYEYSYIRRDENNIENEFSYDINAYRYEGGDTERGHYFELMIECKYRDPSTNWIFSPEKFFGNSDFRPQSYLNSSDFFTKSNRFVFGTVVEECFPPCGKGIELHTNGQNPKSIEQALKQLSYAMPRKFLNGVRNQLHYSDMLDTVWFHIPIIVTTANLYRMYEGVGIADIRKAKSIDAIAQKVDGLLMRYSQGEDLKRYAKQNLDDFIELEGMDLLKEKYNREDVDFDFWLKNNPMKYCDSILVLNFSEENAGFKKLFKQIEELINPSKETLEKFKKKIDELDEIIKEIEAKNDGL